jgi:transposase
LRGVAVGRRYWTFAGSDAGGHRAAAAHRPTSTAAERRRSSQNANAPSLPPSQTVACSIDCRPLKL